MFELFRTYEGEEYTVYVREDGKRFYVDFEEQVSTRFRPPASIVDSKLNICYYFVEMAVLSRQLEREGIISTNRL